MFAPARLVGRAEPPRPSAGACASPGERKARAAPFCRALSEARFASRRGGEAAAAERRARRAAPQRRIVKEEPPPPPSWRSGHPTGPAGRGLNGASRRSRRQSRQASRASLAPDGEAALGGWVKLEGPRGGGPLPHVTGSKRGLPEGGGRALPVEREGWGGFLDPAPSPPGS